MKKFLATIIMISSVTALMTSCKKDALTAPQTNSNSVIDSANTPDNVLAKQAGRPKTLTLTKYGSDSLIYHSDGRLIKVLHGPASYTQYEYGFTTTTAKKYNGGKLQEEVTYDVNIPTNRVFESKTTSYIYNNGFTIVTKTTHKYEYDAAGHITKKYNVALPNERQEFFWLGTENLHQIQWYDKDNKLLYGLQYFRKQNPDRLKLQSQRSGLDAYIKIFGKTSEKLNEAETIAPFGGAIVESREFFNFTFDVDGYPTKFDRINWFTNALLETVHFKYKQ